MIVLIIFFLLALVFMVSSISGAPWVPARAFDIEALLDDVKLKKSEVFFELGCGDGRLVKAAARRGARATGYELNPLLFVVAWLRCINQPGASIRLGNLWDVDLRPADVVMVFLVPRTMPRLHRKAQQELRSSARLVSYIFPIVGKKAIYHSKSWYIYKYPARTS